LRYVPGETGANLFEEVINITDYREILRLHNLGLNNSQIAESVPTSRPTVIAVLRRATEWN